MIGSSVYKDSDMDQGIVIAVFIVIVVLVWVFQYLSAKARREELSTWAKGKGFTFSPRKDRGLEQRFPSYECLRQGSGRYGFNFIEGTWQSRDFLGFDYHYRVQQGKNTKHYYFSAVVVYSDFPLKPLVVRPEGIFDRVKAFFGYEDIDFESAEFSKAFYVSAKDKRWAYDVLHPRAIKFLLDSPRFSIQFDYYTLIAFRNEQFSPFDFECAATVLNGLLEQLPDYVVQQLRDD